MLSVKLAFFLGVDCIKVINTRTTKVESCTNICLFWNIVPHRIFGGGIQVDDILGFKIQDCYLYEIECNRPM